MAENDISVPVPLEQFFMGKWIQDNEIPSISATEIHSFKPLRRSKRTNTINRNAIKLHCTSHVLFVPTHTKEQRKKRDKVNSNPQKKDNGCLNVTSQEIQRESSLSSKKMCHSVTKEADKENHTLTMSNVRVTSNMKCRVILSELPVNIVGKVMKECEDKVRSRRKASNETKNKKEESKRMRSNNNNKNEESKKTNSNNDKEILKTTNRNNNKTTNNKNNNKKKSKNTNSKNRQQDTNANYDKTTRPISITENDMEKGMSMKTRRKTSVVKENQVEKATEEGKQKNVKDTRKRKKRKASVFLYDTDDDDFYDDDDDNDISWTDSRVDKKAKLKVTKEKIENYEPRERKKEKPVGKATIINNGQTKEQTKAAQIKHKRGANNTETQQSKSNTKKSKAQQTNKNRTKTQKHAEQKKKLEAQQNKKSTNKPKTSDGHKKIISHHEDPMPEACAVTAKQGTLKYLKQREKYVEATAKEAHVDQDFFLDKIGLTPKKSKVSQLLMPGSMDDSLTITTPKSSTSTSDGDALDTPRVHLMGMLGGYTPTSDTPTTPASETKRDALVLVYHHLHANKGKPRGVRKSLQMSQSSSTVIPEQPHKKLTPLEINTLLGHQEGCNNDSSVDEYFEDITDVPSPVW